MKRQKIYPNLQAYLKDQKRKGVTQGEFASRMGISEGWLSDLKSGRASPGWKLARRLSEECGIPIESFIEEAVS